MCAVSMKSGVLRRTSAFGGSTEKFCEAFKVGKSFTFSVNIFANSLNEFRWHLQVDLKNFRTNGCAKGCFEGPSIQKHICSCFLQMLNNFKN